MLNLLPSSSLTGVVPMSMNHTTLTRFRVRAIKFPPFLPEEVDQIKDPFARKLASRIERLPVSVSFSDSSILSSCVQPVRQNNKTPVVLLHGFDSSCLEWRYTYPLLEEAGLETWAVDILGWGFSDLERIPSCDVSSKRRHLYQFWKQYVKRPMMLIGPSLGAAVAIDFAVNHPEAVEKLVLIDASVYAEGTGNLAKLPRALAYAGVYVLKSVPLRLYANVLFFKNISFTTSLDWTNIGRLHCLFPWWEDANVDFMISGGYNVKSQIPQVKQKTLIIWGEDDQIVSSKLGVVEKLVLIDASVYAEGTGNLAKLPRALAYAGRCIRDQVKGKARCIKGMQLEKCYKCKPYLAV